MQRFRARIRLPCPHLSTGTKINKKVIHKNLFEITAFFGFCCISAQPLALRQIGVPSTNFMHACRHDACVNRNEANRVVHSSNSTSRWSARKNLSRHPSYAPRFERITAQTVSAFNQPISAPDSLE